MGNNLIYFVLKKFFSFLILLVVATQIIFPLKINIYISNFFIYLLIISYFFFLLRIRKFIINYFIILYLIFSIYALSSNFWSIDFEYSLPISLRLIFISLTIFVIYNITYFFKNEDYILFGILLGAFVNYLILFHIINYITPYTNPLRFTGTLARSNDLAIVMLLSIISSLIIINKNYNRLLNIFALVNIPLAMYSIFLTLSKKGIIFGSLLILLYIFFEFINIEYFKKHLKKIIIFIILISFFVFNFIKTNEKVVNEKIFLLLERFNEFTNGLNGTESYGSTIERIHFIKEGFNFFNLSPLFGNGVNTFIFLDSTHHYSHNNYIELLVGLGLLGLILYYLIYFISIKKLFETININISKVLIINIIILFFMDIALVSYSYKLIIINLLYISIVIENFKSRIENEK